MGKECTKSKTIAYEKEMCQTVNVVLSALIKCQTQKKTTIFLILLKT